MHETGLVRDLVRQMEQVARDNHAKRVSGAAIWLGALSHLSPGHFREHFDIEARGSLAEGARLVVTASDDTGHPDAQHLRLESLDLEV